MLFAFLVSPLAMLAILAIAVAILAVFAKSLGGKGGGPAAGATDLYSMGPSILTRAERSFAGVLDGAVPEGVMWLAKVRLGDIFITKKGLATGQRASAWNRVNQKHVDFLLVRASDFAPLVGLELDDRSHEEEERKARDGFVDGVFHGCGLPLLHITAQAAYNQAELRTKIATALCLPS